MSDLRHRSREFIEEFIDLYRQNECLWKVKDKDYMNKMLKHSAYEKLLEKLLEIDKNANIESVKKKINGLRTNYRSEMKKVHNSMKSGVGSENIYQPTLWYFDNLNFIKDQEIPRKGLSSRNQLDEYVHIDDDISIEDSSFLSPAQSPKFASVDANLGRPTVKRKLPSAAENVLNKVSVRLDKVKEDDKCDAFGKHIAHQLRTMSLTDQIYAQKLISDIIFEIQLGRRSQINISPLSPQKGSSNDSPCDNSNIPSRSIAAYYTS